ncbi:unnamed protein product [Heligmosomoides polygyrus]|uniref:Integrase n=1 Tax=Heligmosomoides polygyrus TaxID=6339 RepID=A0A183G2V0_HELPZ|nr:unnamed protein product [Heligmosomoides polygyrus]
MLRWAYGCSRRDRVQDEEDGAMMKTAPIQLKMKEPRLRWYGRILRRPKNHPIRLAVDFEEPGKRPRLVPKKSWRNVIKRDIAEVGATVDDALDRMSWQWGGTIDAV